MKKILFSTLSLLALSGCGAAPAEGGEGNSESASKPVPAAAAASSGKVADGAELLATVSLSATHTITFYRLNESDGFAVESFKMDEDKPALIGKQLLRTGLYAEVYQRLAGKQIDSTAVEKLRAFDTKAALAEAAMAGKDVDTAALPALEQAVTPPTFDLGNGNVEKDFWSDVDWFRNTFCGGCIGDTGVRPTWGVPSTWPTCGTAPELCSFFGAPTATFIRKSRNADIQVFNVSSSTSDVNWELYLADNTEHCRWREIVWQHCGRGGSGLYWGVSAPGWSSGIVVTSNLTNTYGVNTVQPGDIGVKIDLY